MSDQQPSTSESQLPGLPRTRSTFLVGAATDEASRLHRRSSAQLPQFLRNRDGEREPLLDPTPANPYDPLSTRWQPTTPRISLAKMFHGFFRIPNLFRRKREGPQSQAEGLLGSDVVPSQQIVETQAFGEDDKQSKPGKPAPAGTGSKKLGTFSGVFVPTVLNVLSILMFLRFGFVIGQTGVLGSMGMLIASYIITVITTLSLSAIATNGTVRGGGAYYLISRSLGPEFGGSIGLVHYLGFVFNTSLNAIGLVECFTQNFGSVNGKQGHWLPESYWWNYLWATLVLVTCSAICLAGSGAFARASNGLLVVLTLSACSIPISALIVHPFTNSRFRIRFTGPSLETLRGNLLPHFTKGAAGSQIQGKEDFQDVFGVLFPSTVGIFA